MLLWALAVGFCELNLPSWGPMAVTLCHWVQSETNNTTENSVSACSQHRPQNCISTMWECSLGIETGLLYIKSYSQSICWSLVSLCVLAKCVLATASARVWQICMQDIVGSWTALLHSQCSLTPSCSTWAYSQFFILKAMQAEPPGFAFGFASPPSHQRETVAVARDYSDSSLPC